jgi:hypothetical protein
MANTKIGDIFSVKIDNLNKKYFQLISFDMTQLNSDVIRAFKSIYSIDEKPTQLEIVNDDVDFYAHCITKIGLKMGIWDKYGNNNNIGNIDHILFRGSKDSGSLPGQQIKISNNWYIWKINDQNFTYVGRLEGENQKAELGIVVNPKDIVTRLSTGKYSFFYPNFE